MSGIPPQEFPAAEIATRRSRALGRDMPVARYGAGGPCLLWVPTSGGDHLEFERYGLHRVAAPWIRAGRLHVRAMDARGPHTLFDDAKTPRQRIASYVRLEAWARDELMPELAAACGPLHVVGASYGAFVAVNLWVKRTAAVARIAGLGGVYEMHHRLDGLRGRAVFEHTPLDYLPRLAGRPAAARLVASTGIDLFAARGDSWFAQTPALAKALRALGVAARVDVWDRPHGHHESTWAAQLDKHLRAVYGDP